MSVTEHEANNSVMFVSDKLWSGLGGEEKQWVRAAAEEVSRTQPVKAFDLEHQRCFRRTLHYYSRYGKVELEVEHPSPSFCGPV